ncbi:uncharacterized protein LOC116777398 [Danaus plexippus]|uniref:uncharacterized protein LOC116777398 n=1 Tax=Danaus plexippus TaxID=13037 RepID=UPI0013C41899|nr:uncharacterized protein LOC116777398 [Danaus plexippus]
MDSDSFDSGFYTEMDDSISSSDELDLQHPIAVRIPPAEEDPVEEAAPSVERRSLYSLGYLNFFEKKPASLEEEMNSWYDYMRAYTPLMHLMLEEYKFRWDHYQYKRRSRMAANFQDSEDDSDNSNSSITSSIVDGFPNSDEVHTHGFNNHMESIRPGYYIFLSYFQGGWPYPLVKRFLKTQMGLRCFRSQTVNEALTEQDDFRALIKFRSVKARADVFTMLSENEMLDQFKYVCVDADENYFNYGVIKQLRYTKGCVGLPTFLVAIK